MDGAIIRYTLDGSEPSPARGLEYRGPLAITNTTVLRAARFDAQQRRSAIATYSFLFLPQVLHQSSEPPGLPAGATAWNGYPSAYEMDPRVVDDPLYHDRMEPALRSLPVLSVICRKADLFSPRSGIYFNSLERGETWERPCSVELILPDGSTAFQIDCAIRVQGNYNRIPMKSPKHSFRLLFKSKYGPSKLRYRMFPDSPVEKFDTLVLRADYNNSWIHWEDTARPRAQRTRDAWMKDSQRAMGWVSGHNRYLHLFLNGLYWGVYDAAERLDGSFAAAYWGGDRDDYDVVNEFQVKSGNDQAFRVLHALTGLGRNSQFDKTLRLLNVPEFIDYLLLNYYAGNEDLGENKNWYAIRRRAPAGPFHYLVWDGEQVLQSLRDDTVNNPYETPFRLAEELASNAEYRLAFADRVQKHLFNDGALTPAAAAARWMKRAREVDLAIVAESARWGYYRSDPPFTRDREWLAEQRRLLQSYFPKRTAIVLQQLRAAGLFPKIAAPVFSQPRGTASEGFQIALSAQPGGTVYYTTNGSDPRMSWTGAISAQARIYTNAIPVGPSLQVKARALKEGVWSALSEGP